MYSSIQTSAALTLLASALLREYGAFLGKTWPTWEQGWISRLPPHCQI